MYLIIAHPAREVGLKEGIPLGSPTRRGTRHGVHMTEVYDIYVSYNQIT